MDLIKISSVELGLIIKEELEKKGIKPRFNSQGLLSLEFTQEELNMITELEIINPASVSFQGVENLRNLKKLYIKTNGNNRYNLDIVSITDKDIKSISKVSSLESLTIINQERISWVDVTDLTNLKELNIINNKKIDCVYGLDKLKNIKELSIYGNKELYEIDGICDLITNNELDLFCFDLYNFSEIISVYNKLPKLNCFFVESISSGKEVNYNPGIALLFHQKCSKIAAEIQKLSNSKRMSIVLTEAYLAKNIKYDDAGSNRDKRYHTINNKKVGFNYGTNSAYNGIMFGSCVCEGYSRSMQYLLKLMGIKTKVVSCIHGTNMIKTNDYNKYLVELPDKGYHSIIRIDDENYLYCDPCFDSIYWQAGIKNLPYCLLTTEEMSKHHTFSFEEKGIDSSAFKISREEIKGIVDKYNTQDELKNKAF